ncbi:hypothetical protein KSZ_01350 [Dictyobacter formicarum]|uniref:Uncharacterized protein n=1 Tax=Dictyobacter formicarum TaxID=2778368 RepID=A0ABQ3V8G0_9CHLR|nr:hypothetical protein KSZ_01350 [Dictyobacter formicarum]
MKLCTHTLLQISSWSLLKVIVSTHNSSHICAHTDLRTIGAACPFSDRVSHILTSTQ